MRLACLALGLTLAACAGPNAAGDNGPASEAPPPEAAQTPAEAGQTPAPEAEAPPPAATAAERAAPQPGPATDLRCQVSCSRTKLRTGVATVSWGVNPGSGERAVQEQALDMSVFSDGFATGAYARLFPLHRGGSPTLPRGPIPSAPRAFEVEATTVRAVPEANRMEVRIEGVEPGLNYFFRVASSTRGNGDVSPPVSCTAPVCPADMKPMPQQP